MFYLPDLSRAYKSGVVLGKCNKRFDEPNLYPFYMSMKGRAQTSAPLRRTLTNMLSSKNIFEF